MSTTSAPYIYRMRGLTPAEFDALKADYKAAGLPAASFRIHRGGNVHGAVSMSPRKSVGRYFTEEQVEACRAWFVGRGLSLFGLKDYHAACFTVGFHYLRLIVD